jgi:peptidyl-tRNA hydrolase, PTH1 family
MLVIYGLGNNESKYLYTKHNAGRVVLEKIATTLGLSFQKKDKFAFAATKINGQEVYLIYSLGYMNLSGEPLSAFCKYFKLDFKAQDSNLVILQDDSDQIESRLKLLPGGGSAGHHGINSIYQYLLNLKIPQEQIWRLKIGIRPPENKLRSETFVLKPLTLNELSYLHIVAHKITKHLPYWLENDFAKAQTDLNQSLTLD